MLIVRNPKTQRETHYYRAYLVLEAKRMARYAPDSDGKLRAWRLIAVEGAGVTLEADYLTADGTSKRPARPCNTVIRHL